MSSGVKLEKNDLLIDGLVTAYYHEGQKIPECARSVSEWIGSEITLQNDGNFYMKIGKGTGSFWSFAETDIKKIRKAVIIALCKKGAPLSDIITAAIKAGQSLEEIKTACTDQSSAGGLLMHLSNSEKLVKSGQRNIILQGPPGTGKTFSAKIISELLARLTDNSNTDERIKLVQFHPSTSYEDFIRGIKANTKDNSISYDPANGILGEICDEALANEDKNYVLIIDEINRANLPAVLGECIYALEYRGEPVETPFEVKPPKVQDPKNSRKPKQFIIPENLIIIGTMNTADRSVGQMDYAIRRRFAFIDLLPDEKLVTKPKAKKTLNKVLSLFGTLEEGKFTAPAKTLSPDFFPEEVAIGHSYFLGEDWEQKFKYQALPILCEYVKDGVLQDVNIEGQEFSVADMLSGDYFYDSNGKLK